jgi:carboxymethylenebutenolidase
MDQIRRKAMLILTRPEGGKPEDLHLTRRGAAAVFFTGYAAAALSAQADPIHTDEAGLIIEAVTLPAPDGFHLPGYLARPKAKGRFPTVIVASEIFGVHEYIKDVCRRFAKLGYVAVAPAFFVRVGDPAPIADIGAVMKIVSQASDQQVMGDVGATLKFLKSQTYVDAGRIAITGFCYGGGVTWLACETFGDFKCGVAWYGKMVPPAVVPADSKRLWPVQMVGQLHCPVLGLYGAKDGLAAGIPAMRAALAAAHKTTSDIIVYPDAGHGFHADYRSSYNAADATDGWTRLLAFFAHNGVEPKHHVAA